MTCYYYKLSRNLIGLTNPDNLYSGEETNQSNQSFDKMAKITSYLAEMKYSIRWSGFV